MTGEYQPTDNGNAIEGAKAFLAGIGVDSLDIEAPEPPPLADLPDRRLEPRTVKYDVDLVARALAIISRLTQPSPTLASLPQRALALKKGLQGLEAIQVAFEAIPDLDKAYRYFLSHDVADKERAIQRHTIHGISGPELHSGPATGMVSLIIWDIQYQLDVLREAMSELLADAEAARPSARPRESWKRWFVFSYCWTAYEIRRIAGLSDPIPSRRNGVIASLNDVVQEQLGVTRATAEKMVADTVALVRRVTKGTLSDDDRFVVAGAKSEGLHPYLFGETIHVLHEAFSWEFIEEAEDDQFRQKLGERLGIL